MRKALRFFSQTLTVGLVAAVVLLLLPQWQVPAPVARFTEAPRPPADAGAHPASGPVSYADAVSRAAPAVVNINTAKVVTQRPSALADDPVLRRLFGDLLGTPRQRLETSLGSGVLMSAQGYVVTNHHVTANADQVEVMLQDGRQARATIVGSDPETDIAVLRIDLPDLPAITIGRSEDLRVGDVVLAIGNPFGVGQTVTMGIVSATGRSDLGINTFENFIQTDAAINPGNSGGALVNPSGELVGINTAIYSGSGGSVGIGFAIPVSLATGVMSEILRQGHVTRGWLGLEIQDVSADLVATLGLDRAEGVVVTGVLRDGPAHRAGVEPGDVLLGIGGRPMRDRRAVLEAISGARPGTATQLTLLRQGRPLSVEAQVAQRPAAAQR